MKKISIIFMTLFVLAACSKDDDNDNGSDAKKSDAKEITAFTFLASENEALDEDVKATIDKEKKTIMALVPSGTNTTSLKPTLTLSDKATVDPKDKTTTDFSKEVIYTVTAEDGSKQKYPVNVSTAKSSAKEIISFVFKGGYNNGIDEDIKATIDNEDNTIMATLPSDADLTSLKPTLTLSEKATVNPKDKAEVDFSDDVAYTVTAEDGSTQEYVVSVSKPKSGAKEIISFVFLANDNGSLVNDVMATIDKDKKTIIAQIPSGTIIKELKPSISISTNATINPKTKAGIDFNDEVVYTVTAEDGSKMAYTVIVGFPQNEIDREALVALYNANPGNTMGWDLKSKDISRWEGITLRNNRVWRLILRKKGIISLPPEIGKLANLETLDLSDNELENIPKEIGELRQIETLRINGNSQIKKLPNEMKSLTKLRTLSLYGIKFSEIPELVWELSNLTNLNIGNTNITRVSPRIGNLKKLDFLTLSKNRKIRTLPSEMGNLENLRVINSYDTDLLYDFPDEVCKLVWEKGLIITSNYLYCIK
ncbi:MAG: DUF5018 domain-containing protein [Bacteroidota bacterium]